MDRGGRKMSCAREPVHRWWRLALAVALLLLGMQPPAAAGPAPGAAGGAELVRVRVARPGYHLVSAAFTVSRPGVYVNLRYRLYAAGTGALAAEFWAYGTAAAAARRYDAPGAHVVATLRDFKLNPGPGRYKLVTELWWGAAPEQMLPGTRTDTQNLNIRR